MSGKKEQHKPAVISVGTIPNLLMLREAILQSSGFLVFTTTNPADAVQAMARSEFDVLLLCYSIRNEWRSQLIDKFRETCRRGRIVAITDRPVTEVPREIDEIVYGIEGPDALMHAIRGGKAA